MYFQKNLQKEVRALTSDDKHIIKGDKSGSLYKIDQKDYKILMKTEIQKFMKKQTVISLIASTMTFIDLAPN